MFLICYCFNFPSQDYDTAGKGVSLFCPQKEEKQELNSQSDWSTYTFSNFCWFLYDLVDTLIFIVFYSVSFGSPYPQLLPAICNPPGGPVCWSNTTFLPSGFQVNRKQFLQVFLYFFYFIVVPTALLLKASSDIDSKGTIRNKKCSQERKALQDWHLTSVTSMYWSWIMLPLLATVTGLWGKRST